MTDHAGNNALNRKGIGYLIRIFVRSLFVQASWNFSRMQNIAVAFSLIPLVRQSGGKDEKRAGILTRHLELFNTHPYFTGPIIGSVVKLEENAAEVEYCDEAVKLKKALMAPYAAIGVPFFWGSLRPLSSVVAVFAGIAGFLSAPLLFLLIYNPYHVWVRLRGFIEGYRDGEGAVNFIRKLDLPDMSRKFRWISVVLLGVLGGTTITIPPLSVIDNGALFSKFWMLMAIILCYWVVKRGISPLLVLYGSSLLFLVFVM